MLEQRKELNFAGQNIYVGIDVHLKNWNVTILTERIFHKQFSQPPEPATLSSYLKKHFPGGTYHSAYEAGFCGFWIHYKLTIMGIKNIVVNAADVPSTQKEVLQKTDPIDSGKLARSLRSGELTGIYIPDIETLGDRSLLRARSAVVKDLTRMKQRTKSLLYFYGIDYPEVFKKNSTHWSRRFMKWLAEDVDFKSPQGNEALRVILESVEEQRKILLSATRKVRQLSRSEKYAKSFELIRTVPGVALLTGMTFLTEIEDIKRFANTDKFAGYVGLVPTCHSSGQKESKGEMTFRGQEQMKKMLIESAWTAIRADPALSMCYHQLCQRMESNNAIIRIARKLLNRIYFVLKNNQKYEFSVVK